MPDKIPENRLDEAFKELDFTLQAKILAKRSSSRDYDNLSFYEFLGAIMILGQDNLVLLDANIDWIKVLLTETQANFSPSVTAESATTEKDNFQSELLQQIAQVQKSLLDLQKEKIQERDNRRSSIATFSSITNNQTPSGLASTSKRLRFLEDKSDDTQQDSDKLEEVAEDKGKRYKVKWSVEPLSKSTKNVEKWIRR
eukprot:Nk52_evm1s530 gene=Nk52_evmTU1s530